MNPENIPTKEECQPIEEADGIHYHDPVTGDEILEYFEPFSGYDEMEDYDDEDEDEDSENQDQTDDEENEEDLEEESEDKSDNSDQEENPEGEDTEATDEEPNQINERQQGDYGDGFDTDGYSPDFSDSTQAREALRNEIKEEIEEKLLEEGGEEIAAVTSEVWVPVGIGCVILFVIILCIILFFMPPPKKSEASTCVSADNHAFPVEVSRVTEFGDHFGFPRPGRQHTGTDIMHKKDEKVNIYAVTDGTIDKARCANGGCSIYLQAEAANDTNYYYYTHLYDLSVKAGDKVKTGQLLGHSGGYNVGAQGDHLHMSIGSSKDGLHVNIPRGSGLKTGQQHAPAPYEGTLNPYFVLKPIWEAAKSGSAEGNCEAGGLVGDGNGVIYQASHQNDHMIKGTSLSEAEVADKIAKYAMNATKTKNKNTISSYPSQSSLNFYDNGSNACVNMTQKGTGYYWEIEQSNKIGPKLFVSIHVNASTGNVIEPYYHSGDTASKGIGSEFAKAIAAATGLKERPPHDDKVNRNETCKSEGNRYKDKEGNWAFYSIDPDVNKAGTRVILEIGDSQIPSFWTEDNMKKIGEAIASVTNKYIQ